MDQTTAHYLRLTAELNTPFRIHEPIPVTIGGLSEILFCTQRNVKFILRRLEEKRLIDWQPGRGRGHTSELTFLRSVEEVLESNLQELIAAGRIRQGIELIGLPEVSGPLKERLLALLNKQMGYHSEEESTSGLDILRITRNRHNEKLDPAFVFRAFEAYLIGQLCSTLVSYDTEHDIFLPGLAHMWEANKDCTSYMFYLRKGVRFHHGRVMTARDVKETVQRLIDIQSAALWHLRDLKQVEVLGDHRIRFDLQRPNHFFLHLLSSVDMSIIPYDLDFQTEPCGTGPYRLLKMNEDVMVLAAFDDYYGIRPLLDRVEIWYLPPYENISERMYQLPGCEPAYAPGDETNTSMDYSALGCRYIIANFHKPGKHHSPLVRETLGLLYHPVALIRELGGNRATPASSFLPWMSRSRQWKEPLLSDAQALLEQSGYQGEELILAYALRKEDHEEAEWLHKRADQIGLKLRLLPYTDFDQAWIRKEADLLIAEEVLEDDWQWGLLNYLVNESNFLHACLLEEQRGMLHELVKDVTTLPAPERIALLEHTESVMRDNRWLLYGCHMNKTALLSQSLFGVHTGPFGFLDISKVWIKSSFPEASSGEKRTLPAPHA